MPDSPRSADEGGAGSARSQRASPSRLARTRSSSTGTPLHVPPSSRASCHASAPRTRSHVVEQVARPPQSKHSPEPRPASEPRRPDGRAPLPASEAPTREWRAEGSGRGIVSASHAAGSECSVCARSGSPALRFGHAGDPSEFIPRRTNSAAGSNPSNTRHARPQDCGLWDTREIAEGVRVLQSVPARGPPRYLETAVSLSVLHSSRTQL